MRRNGASFTKYNRSSIEAAVAYCSIAHQANVVTHHTRTGAFTQALGCNWSQTSPHEQANRYANKASKQRFFRTSCRGRHFHISRSQVRWRRCAARHGKCIVGQRANIFLSVCIVIEFVIFFEFILIQLVEFFLIQLVEFFFLVV